MASSLTNLLYSLGRQMLMLMLMSLHVPPEPSIRPEAKC